MGLFAKIAAFAAASATLVSANSFTFVNQDSATRHITFTPAAGQAAVAPITIGGNGQARVDFPRDGSAMLTLSTRVPLTSRACSPRLLSTAGTA